MNRSRHAILVSLLAVLALLCGLAGTASAAFNTAAKNPHFGEFLLQKSEVSASDWLQPADTASGNGAWICDSTLGVPAYVRQNPWTFFDPEGLRTEGGIPDNPDEAEEDRDSYSELDKKIDRTIDDLGKLKKTGPGTGRASASAYFVKAYKLRQSLKEMSAQAAAIYSKLAVYEELNVAGYLMGRRARASADRFIMGDDTFRAFYPEYAGPRDAGIHDFSEEAFAITTLFTSPTSLRVLNSRAAAKGRDELVNLASSQRTTHILKGDATGGGHLFPGAPGKTAFPQGWSGDQVMHHISDIATDPALKWVPQTGSGGWFTKAGNPARFSVEGVRDGTNIKVILEPAGEGIITAFPK